MTKNKVEVAPGVEVSKSEMEDAKKDGALEAIREGGGLLFWRILERPARTIW
jgi:hypothetical protein